MTLDEHIAQLRARADECLAYENECQAELEARQRDLEGAQGQAARAAADELEAQRRFDEATNDGPIDALMRATAIRARANRLAEKAHEAVAAAEAKVHTAATESARACYDLAKEQANAWRETIAPEVAQLVALKRQIWALTRAIEAKRDVAVDAAHDALSLADALGTGAVARFEVARPIEADAREIVNVAIALSDDENNERDVSKWIASGDPIAAARAAE